QIAAVKNTGPAGESSICRDVLLTDAFLSLAKDLKYGRVNSRDSASDSLEIFLLQAVLQEGGLLNHLEFQEPRFAGYQSLKAGLKTLLDAASITDRKLLLGGVTFDSIPLHKTVQMIEINLERWRWEKKQWENRYIFINIPSFMLQLVTKGGLVLESRVIVGKPENQTPELSSVIQCFVTYPYWQVPRKISVEEFLPYIQEDTSFLRRNNFDVLDRKGMLLDPDSLNWKSFRKDYFPVVLRQREGPENSLGIIKFVFDNPYAVFLHDTNAKRLFRNDFRAFSHGCIRMEKSIELAHYLVTEDIGRKSDMLKNYLRQELRHTVDVQNPIPIHTRYFTIESRGDQLIIFDDIYNKDQELIDNLYVRHTRSYY
ncbi:MAG: L,D-transpeptidase family protein, partial [Cyclobacteriaceae bacterium]